MPELRCVCHQLSFAALLSFAQRRGITTFAELSAATRCGTNCGTCRPYIEWMLAHGIVPTCADVDRIRAELGTATPGDSKID